MDALAAAELPETGVGLVVHLVGAVADTLKGLEILSVRRPQQAFVEEGLHGGQDNLSVHVVLQMLVGLVADAHRSHAAIAGQVLGEMLGQGRLHADAVERLHVAASGAVDEIAQIAEIVLEHVGRAQAVQGLDHVVRVSQPAVAVVPVAAALGVLGDRGGQGRDDGSRLLVRAELECDGGADHRLLPLERDGQVAHPAAPVGRGLAQHPLAGGGEVRVEAFVRAKEHRYRLFQAEQPLAGDVRNRGVGGQPQGGLAADEADVIGACRVVGGPFAPVDHGPHADADLGCSDQRAHQADNGKGPINPAELPIAGAKSMIWTIAPSASVTSVQTTGVLRR